MRRCATALLLLLACGPSEDPPTIASSGSASAATRDPTSDTSDGQTSQPGTGEGTSADGTGGSGGFDVECNNPTPILQPDGSPSGFEQCDDGFIHRATATACVVPEPPALCEALSGGGSCSTSTECNEAPNGACVDDGIVDPSRSEGCHCEYACESDDDCGDGQVCACATAAGSRPQCIPAGCVDSESCGGLCGLDEAVGDCGGSTFALFCLDSSSECRPGSCALIPDCSGEGMVSPPCVITIDGWACQALECFTSCG